MKKIVKKTVVGRTRVADSQESMRNLPNWKVELDEVDREIMRFMLEKPTRTRREVATWMGLSTNQVQVRATRLVFRVTMAEFQKKAIDVIMAARERAARKLVRLIDSPDDAVSAKVCLAFLSDILKSSDGVPVGATEVQEWMILGRKIKF